MDLVVTGGCGPCDVHAGDLYYRQCFQPRGSDEQTDLSVPHLTLVGLSELNEWASRNILYGEGEEILQVFQIATNSLEDSSIPAADFNVFPEYTECRPEVSNDNIIDTILALATGDGIY
ncbi:hypothetical protein GQ600_13903 [Phytophthora cactorum]|nr:hypothetical protein GQ600_13903 [Phytophthora cactorum]